MLEADDKVNWGDIEARGKNQPGSTNHDIREKQVICWPEPLVLGKKINTWQYAASFFRLRNYFVSVLFINNKFFPIAHRLLNIITIFYLNSKTLVLPWATVMSSYTTDPKPYPLKPWSPHGFVCFSLSAYPHKFWNFYFLLTSSHNHYLSVPKGVILLMVQICGSTSIMSIIWLHLNLVSHSPHISWLNGNLSWVSLPFLCFNLVDLSVSQTCISWAVFLLHDERAI